LSIKEVEVDVDWRCWPLYTLQQGRVNDAVKGWGTIGVKRYFGNGCGGADEHITKQLEVLGHGILGALRTLLVCILKLVVMLSCRNIYKAPRKSLLLEALRHFYLFHICISELVV